MFIGIIGAGVVGDAMIHSFRSHSVNVVVYDKYKQIGSLIQLLGCDIIFVCLPTPHTGEGEQPYDVSEIVSTLKQLSRVGFVGSIVLKSTLAPGTTDALQALFPTLQLFHNPEFLSSKTAQKDFHNQKHIVIGCTSSGYDRLAPLQRLYTMLYPTAEISICSAQESETMKLFCNSFYASKILLFNQFHEICHRQQCDFSTVVRLMLKNKWIHPMHTQVPGHDGQFGFGGACFPKDVQALAAHMKVLDIDNTLVQTILSKNQEYRFPEKAKSLSRKDRLE